MNSYQVTADRRPAWMLTGILSLLGLLLIFSGKLGLRRFAGVVALLGFGCIIAAIMIVNRYLLTNYLYEIETAPNALSDGPKLNIYASRGHNYGHQFYCLPIESCYGITFCPKKEKQSFQSANCCASMGAKNIYLVCYDCEGKKQGIYLECDKAFADLLENLIQAEGKKEA